MIEDNGPVTVAGYLYVAIRDLLHSLFERANAEDLNMNSYQGVGRKGIVRTYRLVFVSAWVLFMIVMFHVGSIVVSRTMVQDKLSVDAPADAIDVGALSANERGEPCEKTKQLCNLHAKSQSNSRLPPSDQISQIFRRTLRGFLLSTLYYITLFGLFSLIDILLSQATIIARCVGFMWSSILAAPLHVLWTHTMIGSQLPDTLWSKTSLRNIFNWPNLWSLLFASLLYSGSQVFVIVGPTLGALWVRTGPLHVEDIDILSIPMMTAFAFVCIHLPAATILTRVEWLLMPRNDILKVSASCSDALPVSEKPVAKQQDRYVPLLDVIRVNDSSIFLKTLMVYSIFIAALIASILLFISC